MASAQPVRDALDFPEPNRIPLEDFLPKASPSPKSYPHTTLTFATSLDSALSLSPGTQTPLSGPQSKAMTHYLRSRHDGILIGVNTAIADNPSLNCRLSGVGGSGGNGLRGQPRPIVIDPQLRWDFMSPDCKLLKLVKEAKGLAPWIITRLETRDVPTDKRSTLESLGGKVISIVPDIKGSPILWATILSTLFVLGLESIMIEGGAGVINSLLTRENANLVSSVIVTIAPTWLGQGGVVVSPPTRLDESGRIIPAVRLNSVNWIPLGEDVVMCGRIKR
jgi:2,5-diamino-6-(ribosylamino)-4(3H)-pyrimidinone 5'-phosphate reductase